MTGAGTGVLATGGAGAGARTRLYVRPPILMHRPVAGLRFIPGGHGTTSSERRTGIAGARYTGAVAAVPTPAPKIEATRGLRTVDLGAGAGA